MSKPDISVIIVNWKVRKLLAKCLDSILENSYGFNLEIFVVDNDSIDGTPEMIMVKYPKVKMICLHKNYGFAKANNLAIKQARADCIFLLNPDTEILPGFFSNILNYLNNNPIVGIVGPKILNNDGSLQPSIRRFPDILSQILVMLKLRNVLGDNKFLDHYLAKDFDYDQEQEVEQIMGAAMIIRREVIERIGMLDEKYFVWFEEVDYCQRANKAGFTIKYFPGTVLIHAGGSSFGQQLVFKNQLVFDRSLLWYFWKHKPFWQWLIVVFLVPINLILTLIYVLFLQKQEE